MSSDYIIVGKRLAQKAQVVRISSATCRTPQEVVGWLVQFWGWVSDETRDGYLPGMRPEHLAQAVGADVVLWEAVKDVGWLVDAGTALQIPDFDRYLSQDAMRRTRERARKREERSVRSTSANCPRSVRVLSAKCPAKARAGKHGEEEVLRPPPKSISPEHSEEEFLGPPPPPEAPTADEVLAAWNAVPGFAPAREMTSGRLRSLRARVRSRVWVRDWRAALAKAATLPFCLGQGERKWQANLDWFLRPDTVNKVLEGHYDRLKVAGGGKDMFAGVKEFVARGEAAHDAG